MVVARGKAPGSIKPPHSPLPACGEGKGGALNLCKPGALPLATNISPFQGEKRTIRGPPKKLPDWDGNTGSSRERLLYGNISDSIYDL
jgi:hypothetical protein